MKISKIHQQKSGFSLILGILQEAKYLKSDKNLKNLMSSQDVNTPHLSWSPGIIGSLLLAGSIL